MIRLINKLRLNHRNKIELRQSLPIAARIMQSRISAQENGRDCDITYGEIASEAVSLVRAVRKEIYNKCN